MMEYRCLLENDVLMLTQFVDDQHTQYKQKQIIDFLGQDDAFGFVAADNGQIAGFAYGYRLEKPDGQRAFYLHALDIMDKYQNQGHGTKLIRFIWKYVKKMGCNKMFLVTEAENKAACKCYEKADGVGMETVLYKWQDE